MPSGREHERARSPSHGRTGTSVPTVFHATAVTAPRGPRAPGPIQPRTPQPEKARTYPLSYCKQPRLNPQLTPRSYHRSSGLALSLDLESSGDVGIWKLRDGEERSVVGMISQVKRVLHRPLARGPACPWPTGGLEHPPASFRLDSHHPSEGCVGITERDFFSEQVPMVFPDRLVSGDHVTGSSSPPGFPRTFCVLLSPQRGPSG